MKENDRHLPQLPPGKRCPRCGHRASPLAGPPQLAKPLQSQLRDTQHTPLYRCNIETCPSQNRPFEAHQGGITHRRHRTCPPTNQLELLQEPESGDTAELPNPIRGLTAIEIIEQAERLAARPMQPDERIDAIAWIASLSPEGRANAIAECTLSPKEADTSLDPPQPGGSEDTVTIQIPPIHGPVSIGYEPGLFTDEGAEPGEDSSIDVDEQEPCPTCGEAPSECGPVRRSDQRERRRMSEHFTRNTLSTRMWCQRCNAYTEWPVSNGRITRCPNDHSPSGPTRARIPAFNYDGRDTDVIPPKADPGALKDGPQAVSMADRLTIQALEGPDSPHDGHGDLPEKNKSGTRRRYR